MIAPDLFSLAVRQFESRDFPRAEQSFRELVAQKPNFGEAWRVLGLIALERNDYRQGFDLLQRSLACDGANPGVWLSLGDYFQFAENRPEAAISHYEQAIRLFPDFAGAHHHLGVALRALGQDVKALAALEKAVRLRPENADAVCHFAELLIDLDVRQVERAVACYRDALRVNPGHPALAAGLGLALTRQGYFEEGVAHLRLSLKSRPHQARVSCLIAELASAGWCQLTPDDVHQIQASAHAVDGPIAERINCGFALARILEDQGSYDEAMHYYHLANALKRQLYKEQNKAFDAQRHNAMVERIIAIYDREYFAPVRGWGATSEAPVFIVGMPRSGSTLVEQILANHPQVYGGGEEAGEFRNLARHFDASAAGDPDGLVLLRNKADAAKLAASYLRKLSLGGPAATRATNKSLLNFMHLGLIATLFPNARVIHCQRDPLDVCVSCYFTQFRYMEFACALDDIAAFYRAYKKLMAHWASVLPMKVHEVRYESLVATPEPIIRNLVSACGLPWDERCLDYHKSHRFVATASRFQVRKPIYKKAVGRWEHFRDHLGPLFEALDLTHGGVAAPVANKLEVGLPV
jgi:tetratricopeptide (TPR) repeat protein